MQFNAINAIAAMMQFNAVNAIAVAQWRSAAMMQFNAINAIAAMMQFNAINAIAVAQWRSAAMMQFSAAVWGVETACAVAVLSRALVGGAPRAGGAPAYIYIYILYI